MRNVAVLMSGTALAQMVMVLSTPFLTRFFSPADFGALGVFGATVGTLSVVAAGRYEVAVPLPATDDDAANLLVLGVGIVLLATATATVAIALGAFQVIQTVGGPDQQLLLRLVPPTMLTMGLYQVLSFWAIRRSQFNRLSVSRVARSLATVGSQVSAGLAGIGSTGLVIGQAIGHGTAALTLSVRVWNEDRGTIVGAVSPARIASVARTYCSFPMLSGPQALLNAVSQNIPVFLLGGLFGPSIAGAYWFTHRLLILPNDLIGQSVRQVFFQRANELRHTGNGIAALFLKATLTLAGIGVLPLIAVSTAGPPIFALLFGGEWETAGSYARWLILAWFAAFINPPAVMLVHTCGLHREHVTFEVLLLCARTAAIAVGWYAASPSLAIALFGLCGCLFNILFVVYVHRRLNSTPGTWAAAPERADVAPCT